VHSVLGCLVPLCWACGLLLVIQWCFSVYFLYAATDYVADGLRRVGAAWLEDASVVKLQEHYGSLGQALYTLFLSVTGGMDWGAAADPLLAVGYHPLFLYVIYVALTIFAVLNVVTSVFVQNATKLALQDHDLVIQEQLSGRREYTRAALRVFREADADGNGWITREEFESHLEDKRVQAFLGCLELTGLEARRLFEMLDADGAGAVDAEQFVAGCMGLRGGAKAMDVAALALEHRRFEGYVRERLDELLARGRGPCGAAATPSVEALAPPTSTVREGCTMRLSPSPRLLPCPRSD